MLRVTKLKYPDHGFSLGFQPQMTWIRYHHMITSSGHVMTGDHIQREMINLTVEMDDLLNLSRPSTDSQEVTLASSQSVL